MKRLEAAVILATFRDSGISVVYDGRHDSVGRDSVLLSTERVTI